MRHIIRVPTDLKSLGLSANAKMSEVWEKSPNFADGQK